MTSQTTSFRILIKQARAGCSDSFKQIVDRYGPNIRRVVKRRIGAGLRSKVDEHDLEQMVWASFYRQKSQVVSFVESQAMMAYLIRIAQNKVTDQYKHFCSDKRSLELERQVDDLPSHNELDLRMQTPSQHMISDERLERLLLGFSDRDRSIVKMRLAEYSLQEIADANGVDESTVRKVITKLRRRAVRDREVRPK